MLTLPSAKVQDIGRLLAELRQGDRLDDLVLILSEEDADRYLLAYNTPHPPALDMPGCSVVCLADLQTDDHLAYTGPIVGMPAIDVLFPEIPTHGPGFCSLERLLPGAGRLLRGTSYRLAETIFARVGRAGDTDGAAIGPRAYAKIAQLALPTLLAESPTLPVAIALPADLGVLFESGLAGCPGWYDLSGERGWERLAAEIDRSSPWLAAFEETPGLLPGLEAPPERLIELRPILWRGVGREKRRGLLRDLARRAWRDAERAEPTSRRDKLRLVAYALAVEASIRPEIAGDLVALLPDDDLECFLAECDAHCIYRSPRPDLPGPCWSLAEWMARPQTIRRDAPAPWFTFPPLRATLARDTGRSTADLGPVLWKAGAGAELARTFWLLSRDLLQGADGWRQIGAAPAQITDLAMRAALLYSLDDPWQWRQGRYPLFLDQCYGHLLSCLQNQERAAAGGGGAEYFRALGSWHAC